MPLNRNQIAWRIAQGIEDGKLVFVVSLACRRSRSGSPTNHASEVGAWGPWNREC